MIPVFMTKFPTRRGRAGNAFRACLASLLERRMDDIPAFEDMAMGDAQQSVVDFMTGQGLTLEEQGWPPESWSIASGKSENGTRHCCVVFNGRVFHDPNPERPGLALAEAYNRIMTIDEAYHALS